MATWILILTIVSNDYRAGGAITSVDAFRDEASCMAAGNAWLKQARPGLSSHQTASALCVKA